MLRPVIVLSLLLLRSEPSAARQTWEKQPEYAEVNPGESVVLQCVINNKEGDCRWERAGVPKGIFPGKYDWAGDVSRGDCSLLISDAELEYDDGEWQCSVTPSRFKAQDALVSSTSSLVVRRPPSHLLIRELASPGVAGAVSDESETIDILENTNVTLECSSVGGKPPPKLSWQLPDSLPSFSLSETVSNGSSISVISALVMRSDSGKSLSCRASHPALVRPLEKSLKINVLYVPLVEVEYKYPSSLVTTFQGSQNVSLREGDSVIIRCKADSNPPASVAWRRAGEMGMWSTQAEVLIENVGRENGGIYTCTAHNRLGVSGPREIVLNVEYSPHIVSLEPSGKISSQIGNRVSLSCLADANPQPHYQWVQRLNDQVIIRGNARILSLENIIFEDDGEYICYANNIIRGEEKITHSAPVHLTVTGPPQLYLDPKTRFESSAGSDTNMEVKVCGEPKPEVQWKVEQLVLTAGTGHGRFKAHNLYSLTSHHNCYISRLTVTEVSAEDNRVFQVQVENALGSETHSLELRVHETSQLEVLIAIAVGGVLTILTICLIIIYVLVSKDSWTWCSRLRQTQGSDISELGSDKTDIESPDSSIITSSANHIFYHHDIRADSSFQTFNRQKKQSLIPCGAYSVTQGSISSISPHRTDRAFSECPRLGESSRSQRNCLNNTAGPPDLSGVSYYRYH